MSQQAEQKIRLTLSPQAQRYARRDAPLEARMMAARGAMPLPPLELATVLFALLHDPHPEVKSAAQSSLADLPESVLDAVLSGDAHPALLSQLAHLNANRESRLEKIALNPRSDDATLVRLAASPFQRVVEIVSQNQERLMRCPEIVDALGSNPLTGRAVIDRILSFLGEPTRDAGEDDAGAPEGEVSEAGAEAALRALLGPEFGDAAQRLVQESSGSQDVADDETGEGSLYALVQKMSVFQKIKLARLGNLEARGLLIRDRNKIVSLAAIQSPKITDNEVVGYAQSRNVGDDVLRVIASNRQWTRSYKVKQALVGNPKCPQTVAIKLVNYLQDQDLRSLVKSKDIPSVIAAQARRILMKKGKI